MNHYQTALLSTLLCVTTTPLVAQTTDSALAGQVHTLIEQGIAAGDFPGAMVLVTRNGKLVVQDVQGMTDKETKAPMSVDSVFPIASMTKPITAVAIMMLVEEGKIALTDPVSRFIPEFIQPAMVRVVRTPGTASSNPIYDNVPGERPITVKDLLTHTSGLQSIGVYNPAVPYLTARDTLASSIPTMAKVPLDFQPGAKWAYSNRVGFDVLARIVEIVSGQAFDVFLQQRILGPLGMASTGYRPWYDARATRMARRQTGEPFVLYGDYYTSGAAGLWSTLSDYTRFAEMLRNRGEFNGRRLLKAETVTTMLTNQVGTLARGVNGRAPSAGFGFGLSMLIVEDPTAAQIGLPKGSFGWDGAGGSRFWVIPASATVVTMFLPSEKVQVQLEQLVGGSVTTH